MTLLRTQLGNTLRGHRLRQRRTLRDVSGAARVSLGYLSEVERGQKEASSELLASICDALDVELADLLAEVSLELRGADSAPAGPLGPSRPPARRGRAGRRAARRARSPSPRSPWSARRPARAPAPRRGGLAGGLSRAPQAVTVLARRRLPAWPGPAPAGAHTRAGNAMGRTRARAARRRRPGVRRAGRARQHDAVDRGGRRRRQGAPSTTTSGPRTTSPPRCWPPSWSG